MNGKRIWLQMRVWIEGEDDLYELLPDPHGYKDVIDIIQGHYPEGVKGFIYDITHSYEQRQKRENARRRYVVKK